MTEAEQIAAFIARRGVTRVPEGTATLTERQLYRAVRGEPTTDDLIRQRQVVIDHAGREHVRNGLGEWIA
jgi:hypothetical protein